MKEIRFEDIAALTRELALSANFDIGEDIRLSIKEAAAKEISPSGAEALRQIAESYDIARGERLAICQDTGMTVVFVDLGCDAFVSGGLLDDAINAGVRSAYDEGCLRKSVVNDPLFDRINTGDNTPAIIHTRVVSGSAIKLTVAPKGFGSENMSRIKMLKPSDGVSGVIDFIVDTVCAAGANPCPPVIVGVGIGGDFESCALMAKRALLKPVGERHSDARYAALEVELLSRINALGIGPAGLGGITTALDVHIIDAPTHIAGMPVAVNMCCHAARHAEGVIEGAEIC